MSVLYFPRRSLMIYHLLRSTSCNQRCSQESFCSSKSDSQDSIYDIIVSGGGIVGCAMAASLGRSRSLTNKSVLLLESAADKSYSPTDKFSNRVSAISPASRTLLQDCGSWDMIAERCCPVKQMSVWEACSSASIIFNQTEAEPLAHIIENDQIVAALTHSAKQCDNVKILYGTTAERYDLPRDDELVKVHINQGKETSEVYTRLLIGADGFKSRVRNDAGINICSREYDQFGVVATLEISSETDENHTAWQRFLPTGPLAVLPLSNTHSSLVWSTTPHHSKQLVDMSEESFVDAINHALNEMEQIDSVTESLMKSLCSFLPGDAQSSNAAPRPPVVRSAASRARFPYGLLHADRYIGSRLALIGDSAHRVHPLAGQGANLGLGDVTCLTRALERNVKRGADVGSMDALLEYETDRQRHNVGIIAGIDALQRLYSTAFTPIVIARSVGLSVVNSTPSLKDFFMAQARYG